jgi:hypothetical protein
MKKNSMLLSLCVLLLITFPVSAHTINYVMETKPAGNVFTFYAGMGFRHILPLGYDHLLFILGIFLLNPNLKPLLAQATCFTLAHSITLILTANNTIVAVPAVVEPLIAISILFIAVENLYIKNISRLRYLLVFAFGLVHGMGFAGALNEVGLPRNSMYTALIGFNIGVELGQITFILLIFLTIGYFRKRHWYRDAITIPLSVGIALVALWWSIERMIYI